MTDKMNPDEPELGPSDLRAAAEKKLRKVPVVFPELKEKTTEERNGIRVLDKVINVFMVNRTLENRYAYALPSFSFE